MISRLVMMSSALLACTGCSDTASQTMAGMTTAGLGPTRANAATEVAAESDADSLRTGQKTMASKVLAAMALERVTGRKPDPSRFAEAN